MIRNSQKPIMTSKAFLAGESVEGYRLVCKWGLRGYRCGLHVGLCGVPYKGMMGWRRWIPLNPMELGNVLGILYAQRGTT
jgi:hypothetical protein